MHVTADAQVAEPTTLSSLITVACIEENRDTCANIRQSLSGDRFDVRTESSGVPARRVFDDVDCVVCGPTSTRRQGPDLLSSVREYRQSLPVVLLTDGGSSEVTESLPETDWTVVLESEEGAAMAQVAQWVEQLVDHYRTRTVARRALAAMETAGDGFAFVEPGGTYEFVNRTFATRFGSDPGELLGQPWEVCFPREEVERLRSNAFPTVREDWQWLGGCIGQRTDDETFTAEVRIAGLDDGSLVFCLSEGNGSV